jgi:hypothetical protein
MKIMGQKYPQRKPRAWSYFFIPFALSHQGANHRKAQSDAAAAQNQADAVDQPVKAEAMFSLFRVFFAKIVIDHAVSHSIAPFAPM